MHPRGKRDPKENQKIIQKQNHFTKSEELNQWGGGWWGHYEIQKMTLLNRQRSKGSDVSPEVSYLKLNHRVKPLTY